MTEREIIKQLKQLKEIKPREEWVLLAKNKIFEEQEQEKTGGVFSTIIGFTFSHKPTFAFAVVAVAFVGLFGFAQSSVPGDSLFPLRKITEKGQAALVSEKDKPKHDLEIVNKRLTDLTKAAEANNTEGVKSAIIEYEETAEEAAKSLVEAKDVKEIAQEIKKIAESEKKIKSLGVRVSTEKLDSALADVVKREISYLLEGSSVLTEEDQAALEIAKQYIEENKYSDALETILMIGSK